MALDEANVERVALHQLRLTGVTPWVREGVDPSTVARRAGHASAVTILDIYSRSNGGLTPADARIDASAAAVIERMTDLTSARRVREGVEVADLDAVREARNGR